jgi:hypothetical protein
MGLDSEGLLRQQQSYLRVLHGFPDQDLGLSSGFPRLRLACFRRDAKEVRASTQQQRITLEDLNVEIFKPVRLEELQYRCRPGAGGTYDMLCVFGVNPRFPSSPSRNSDFRRGGNIGNLVVAQGAGIIAPSNCRTQGRLWDVASRGIVEDPETDFWLA